MRAATLGATFLGLSLAFLSAGPLKAQDKPACQQFEWSIGREQALFDAAGLTPVPSGSKLDNIGSGVALQLQPNASVAFILPPERQPKQSDSFGGVVFFADVPKAGLYQVTLSGEAWLDVIQDGKALASTAHSGKRGCEAVRKSVRFELHPGALTVQLSGSTAKTIKVAVLPAN